MQKDDSSELSDELKDLIIGMLQNDDNARFSMEDIKASKWYNNESLNLSKEEAINIMKGRYAILAKKKKKKLE